jgi:hypothetical protein
MGVVMDLTFKIPSFEYMVNSIYEIELEDMDNFIRGHLFYFYPNIDKDKFYSFQGNARKEYLTTCLRDIFVKEQDLFAIKIDAYNKHWFKNKEIILEAFQDAFRTDLHNEFIDMVGYIGLNPVCPRFLATNTFDVFYRNSERGALGIAMHEIVHFVWFKLWGEYFHDDIKEYEIPNLKWVFSEIIPELIMRDERLKLRNPYSNGQVIYEYFYKMNIDEKPILDILYEMYSTMTLHEFMEKGFQLLQKHEEEIRNAMHS